MKLKLSILAAAIVAASIGSAQRMPTVTYSVSGSSGNWLLDFSVKSNFLSGEGDFYFFGVKLDTGRNIAGSPGVWDPNTWPSWDNSGFGGSSTIYNNNWIDLSFSQTITPGATLGGFQAISTAASAPTTVQWFAYAFGGTYGGNDYFNNSGNPGFEGRAGAVPEPATMAVLGLGVAAFIRRRRNSK